MCKINITMSVYIPFSSDRILPIYITYTFTFHFNSVFNLQNITRQYLFMNYIDHACMQFFFLQIPQGSKFENVLYFSAFFYISHHMSEFLCISLHFSSLFYIFRHAIVSSTYPSMSVCPSQGNLHSVSVCETSQSFETTLRWLTWWPTWWLTW